jgi:hypothetical protein
MSVENAELGKLLHSIVEYAGSPGFKTTLNDLIDEVLKPEPAAASNTTPGGKSQQATGKASFTPVH